VQTWKTVLADLRIKRPVSKALRTNSWRRERSGVLKSPVICLLFINLANPKRPCSYFYPRNSWFSERMHATGLLPAG
jgi:hypothetical protein